MDNEEYLIVHNEGLIHSNQVKHPRHFDFPSPPFSKRDGKSKEVVHEVNYLPCNPIPEISIHLSDFGDLLKISDDVSEYDESKNVIETPKEEDSSIIYPDIQTSTPSSSLVMSPLVLPRLSDVPPTLTISNPSSTHIFQPSISSENTQITYKDNQINNKSINLIEKPHSSVHNTHLIEKLYLSIQSPHLSEKTHSSVQSSHLIEKPHSTVQSALLNPNIDNLDENYSYKTLTQEHIDELSKKDIHGDGEISSEIEDDDLISFCDQTHTLLPSIRSLEFLFDHQLKKVKFHYQDKRLFKAFGYFQEIEKLLNQIITKCSRFADFNDTSNVHNLYLDFCKDKLDFLKNDTDLQKVKTITETAIIILDSFSLGHLKPQFESHEFNDPLKSLISVNKLPSEELSEHIKTIKLTHFEKINPNLDAPSSDISEVMPKPPKQKKRKHRIPQRSFRVPFRKTSLKLQKSSIPPKSHFEDWNREKGKFVDMAYRFEKNLSVSLRVRGKLPSPIANLLAIINEVDLAENWAPYLKSCTTEVFIDKTTQIIRQVFDYPLIGLKESVSFAFAVNTLQEYGCIMLFSVDPPEGSLKAIDVKIEPSKKKGHRIKSADLLFLIYPRKSGEKVLLELYANFYHGLTLVPSRLIAYIIKRLIKSMFISIVRLTQNFETGVYKERLITNKEFYSWLNLMIETYYLNEHDDQHKHIETSSLSSYDDERALDL